MNAHAWDNGGDGNEAPGVVRCHEHGLPAVRAESEHGSVLVYRQGAHVAAYRPAAGPALLWLSAQSRFALGSAIRGGIPLCFPWFGAHRAESSFAAHGFARTSDFAYGGSELGSGGELRLSFALSSDDRTRALWPAEFVARYVVTLGARLGLHFEVENRGREAIEYEEALHSYFVVSNVQKIAISGLAGARYADKVSGSEVVQAEAELGIAGETDRVYDSAARCTLLDPLLDRRITVDKVGSATTVVWNPWVDKARRLSDFGDDEYLGMVCIESANTHEARVRLAPGEAHTLAVHLESSPLSG